MSFGLFCGFFFFFFNDTATTEIYTLSLHDALPIRDNVEGGSGPYLPHRQHRGLDGVHLPRSEEHTSELQSPDHLVCRLLLEKKNNSRIDGGVILRTKQERGNS